MKRIKDKFSRTLAMLLAVIMLVGMLPVTAFASNSAEDVVYLSISFDSHYINDKNGNPIAYVPVPMSAIETIDLVEYGLDNMLYDVDGDGNYETTALQLLIYAHEEIYGGDWGEVNFDALPGSSYFKGGIFGFTENLVYFQNGDFPVDESQTSDWYTVGATSDRIVLEAGDFLDVASFGCFAFLWDMLGGFHLFADENDNYTHDYAATTGEALDIKLKHSFCDLMYGIAWVQDADGFEVYYGTTFGEADGSVTTDEEGNAQITFPSAGTYYIWCDGGVGSDDGTHSACDHYSETGEPCIVSSPAFAKVTVTGAGGNVGDTGNADQEAADKVIALIDAIGPIEEITLDSKEAIDAANAACNELTDAQKLLVGDGKLNTLVAAKEKLAQLQADKDAVDDVIEKINAIGNDVTLESEAAINTALAAYKALKNDELRKSVSNSTTLINAVTELARLKADAADRAAADAVIAKINAIGTVTLESEDAVAAARTAYAALSDEQKALVTNYEALTIAENSLKDFASVSTVLNDTMKKLANTVKEPAFGTNAGEWTVFSLARGGYFNADNKYFTDYYHRIAATVNKVAEEVNMNGALDKNKSTDNARLMVALSAIGRDATFVGGWDLVEAYAKNGINWIRKQGLNGTIWALIALDSNDYETPDDATIRQQCVDAILAAQHDDNGWSLITAKAQTSNVDITGMALVALYPYRDQPEVAEACEKAIAWMSESQLDNGGFPYGLGETSESCAWAIVAATTWGINPDTDPRFIKNGKSAVDNLLTYYVAADKMFAHQGTASNPMATDQACYALVAYSRFMNGEKALFDYSDVTFKETTKVEAVEDLIAAIGKVTVDSGDIIKAARAAYNTLTKDEKDLVSNYDDLEDAEEAYEDFAAAKTVMDLIAAIGKVTTGSEAKILKARNAYEKLTPAQKKLVSNYDDLEDAEEELEEAKVEYVEDLIASIGTVTKDSKQKIDRARSAYNGLSASNKKAVRNLNVLLAAEEAYKKLDEEPADKKTSETVKDLTVIAGKVDKQIESITEESTTGEILDILFAYETLTEGEKAAIGKTNTVAFLKQQVAQEIQTDAKTGIGVSGVDWHIRIAVEDPMDIAKVQSLQETLGKNTMLGLWDIHLEDIQQSAEIQPDGTVLVKIPLALLSDFTAFDGLAVVHYADDGTVEYLNSTVIGDCIAFNAVEFSYYAVVGYMGASPLDGMMSDEADGAAVTPWIIIGCCAVVLLGAAVYLGSKNRRQKAGEQIG
ncbi:MAG: hypothetical protein IKV99_02030 [Oscillospiraceae bacterium]|nr:hypothetical protein [Oscillospiraceae bacterium]